MWGVADPTSTQRAGNFWTLGWMQLNIATSVASCPRMESIGHELMWRAPIQKSVRLVRPGECEVNRDPEFIRPQLLSTSTGFPIKRAPRKEDFDIDSGDRYQDPMPPVD